MSTLSSSPPWALELGAGGEGVEGGGVTGVESDRVVGEEGAFGAVGEVEEGVGLKSVGVCILRILAGQVEDLGNVHTCTFMKTIPTDVLWRRGG